MSRARTAVCTVATGPHAELFDIARPSFERFASIHGHELVVVGHETAGDRPPPWGKVVVVRELLDSYDRVAWVDADAVIVDPARDIFDGVGHRRPFHVVTHHYDGLEVPNLGVLAIRSNRWSRRFLERLWAAEQYIDHKWWENAAALELMGYDVESPRRATRRRTAVSLRVGHLDPAWNSIALSPAEHPCIVHFPGMSQSDRREAMTAAMADLPRTTCVPTFAADDLGSRGLELLAAASAR